MECQLVLEIQCQSLVTLKVTVQNNYGGLKADLWKTRVEKRKVFSDVKCKHNSLNKSENLATESFSHWQRESSKNDH